MKSPMEGTLNESHLDHLNVSTADFLKEDSVDDNSLYLGVYLDPTLNLDMHFYKTYKKAAGRVNLLRRIRSNTDTLKCIWHKIFFALFWFLDKCD